MSLSNLIVGHLSKVTVCSKSFSKIYFYADIEVHIKFKFIYTNDLEFKGWSFIVLTTQAIYCPMISTIYLKQKKIIFSVK